MTTLKPLSILLFIFLWGNHLILAQDLNPSNFTKLTEVIPPSPNAASLGKFGGLNLNLSGGSLNCNVPLYDFKSRYVSVPLSLNYNSSGIRVDEIASRVGMSWSLNAGGLISRTVYGRPDEFSIRLKTPLDLSSQAYEDVIRDLAKSNDPRGGNYDGQPDLFVFNFNGHVGKFILDSSLNPIQLQNEGIKIESHIADSNPLYHFRITTVDGVQYLFGGDFATEATHPIPTGSECGRTSLYTPVTAFYLKAIVHPDGDTVNFTYVQGGDCTYPVGLSQSMFSLNALTGGAGSLTPPTTPTSSVCVSMVQVLPRLLRSISSTSGGSITFSYTGRSDISDSLLSEIDVYSPGSNSTLLRVFSLSYLNAVSGPTYENSYADNTCRNRPFLVSLTERSTDASLFKTHKFSYNDMGALPPRLSFAQDHFGYFNGKLNSTLVPLPNDLTFRANLPQATADREVDLSYAFKGLLTNITYPTGGSDSIVYESNTVYTDNIQPVMTDTTIHMNAFSTNRIGTEVSQNISVSNQSDQVGFHLQCIYTGDPEVDGGPDEEHDKAFLTIATLANPGLAVYSNDVSITFSPLDIVTFLPAGQYVVTLKSTGISVSSTLALTYNPNRIAISGNLLVGGNRVLRVISDDAVTGVKSLKRYYYSKLATPTISSGARIVTPQYEKLYTAYTQEPACNIHRWTFDNSSSNTVNNLYVYASSPVVYSSVVESFGENFENGGIEHYYSSANDEPGFTVLGDPMYGLPLTSFSFRSGQELYQHVFRNTGSGFLPVKKVFNHYKEDQRMDSIIYAYVANQKYMLNGCPGAWPFQAFIDQYDLTNYTFLRKWVYPDSTVEFNYDKDGVSFVSDTVVKEYGNVSHAQVTKITSTLSNGSHRTVNQSYPEDITLSGDAETGRQALVAEHYTAAVIRLQENKGGDSVFTATTDFSVFPNGRVQPRSKSVRLGNFPQEKRLEFTKYSPSGHLTSQMKENDFINTYLWDYQDTYLIAQIANGDSASIAYTSFEADGTGNWTVSATTVDNASSITGRKSCVLNGGSISKTGLTSSNTYFVSYWMQDGSHGALSIAGTMSGYPKAGKTVSFNNVNWTLYVHKVTGQSTISLSGSGRIDELRLYPATAQMTTYTYDPLIGMTSQTDPGNRITYYEYDGLARLKRIRDQDYNILKTFDYQYQVQDGCGGGCYSLAMQTFAGSNTLGYPVGVFNVHGKLLGNAANADEYVSRWNNDTADAALGALVKGKDNFHFNITLNTGKTLPAAVTGCRYYQWDLPWNIIDAVTGGSGAYVDFGDGTGMHIPKTPSDTAGFAPNTTFVVGYYVIHTYPDSSMKTITIYHNEVENIIVDNANIPATSLSKVRHLRGNFPQTAQNCSFSSFQQASALTFDSIYNWNSISSITALNLTTGDGGITPSTNLSFAQDFMKNNQGLRILNWSYWGYRLSGLRDTTFKISRLKSNWNTYFTNLQILSISDEHWDREDLSALTQLTQFALVATTSDHTNGFSNGPIPIPASVLDNVLIQILAGAGQHVNNGFISLVTGGTVPTETGNLAIQQLQSKGWTVVINY